MSIDENVRMGEQVVLGKNVYIAPNCIIEDGVSIGNDVYIDSNTVIRSGVSLNDNTFIGSNCIIGEYLMDFCINKKKHIYPLSIGKGALIRSGTIIYAGAEIGCDFQSGHRVTIRENARIGDHVSIGTLSDIQGSCKIGCYVRMHSNVHIGQLSEVDNFVWIYPYAVLTNDPTPPSTQFAGVHIKPFAVVATGAIIMPGLEVGQDALVAAGAIVTKSVENYAVVGGNPAKKISDIRKVKNHFTGKKAYPWRNEFKKYMPWINSDFKTWYVGLTLEQRKEYGLDKLDLDTEL